jgi:hypothetical protein
MSLTTLRSNSSGTQQSDEIVDGQKASQVPLFLRAGRQRVERRMEDFGIRQLGARDRLEPLAHLVQGEAEAPAHDTPGGPAWLGLGRSIDQDQFELVECDARVCGFQRDPRQRRLGFEIVPTPGRHGRRAKAQRQTGIPRQL